MFQGKIRLQRGEEREDGRREEGEIARDEEREKERRAEGWGVGEKEEGLGRRDAGNVLTIPLCNALSY